MVISCHFYDLCWMLCKWINTTNTLNELIMIASRWTRTPDGARGREREREEQRQRIVWNALLDASFCVLFFFYRQTMNWLMFACAYVYMYVYVQNTMGGSVKRALMHRINLIGNIYYYSHTAHTLPNCVNHSLCGLCINGKVKRGFIFGWDEGVDKWWLL